MYESEKAPLTISSAFPFQREKIFLPMPKNQFPQSKEFKHIPFLEKESFERILHGNDIDEVLSTDAVKEQQKNPLYNIVIVPRVRVDRLGHPPQKDEASYFQFGQVVFNEGAGLYFFYHLSYDFDEKKFKAAIRLLCDEGIGGDRSSGHGLFDEPQWKEITLNVPEKAEGVILLSLCNPDSESIKYLTESYYEIIERKGYMYSPDEKQLRKRTVRMLSEGSVISAPSLKGNPVVDVAPEIFKKHKVLRYGLAFTIPCHVTDGGTS